MIENLGTLERTHSCGALAARDIGRKVTLMGWCERRRDFGPLTFIDLRDRDGITQIVINKGNAPKAHEKAKDVRAEYVLAVIGDVVLRNEKTRNPKISTGAVEVHASEIVILNDASRLPFQLNASPMALAAEELRLKYRYLDLRRPQLQANLRLRHSLLLTLHRFMDEKGFTQIETPNLIKSTPEGARDYIVPFRGKPGKFYALPQSPQMFKQICMIAGLEKYYQIARCFRDEDLRSDRQPEFSQLDIEMSFVTPDHIYSIAEGVFERIFSLIGVALPRPFPHVTYMEAIERFGSDKPDLRIEGMELKDISSGVDLSLFGGDVLVQARSIKCIVVPRGADISSKVLEGLVEFAKPFGADAIEWIKFSDDLSSSLLNVRTPETLFEIGSLAGAQKGDAMLIAAGKKDEVCASLGILRKEVARKQQLIRNGIFAPLWVKEFPLLEFHEDDGRYYSMHHPFTSPLDEDVPLLEQAVNGETSLLSGLRAKAYDMVINGIEVAGGSIRIHRRDVQSLIFQALGISEKSARERFGFFLDALSFGTPPHGGIAAGIERTLMVLVPTENIRDVIAFPKTASGLDLMIDAPSDVDAKQLQELNIQVDKNQFRSP